MNSVIFVIKEVSFQYSAHKHRINRNVLSLIDNKEIEVFL